MTKTTTKTRRRKVGIATQLMNESVRMPGFPQIVVTREFLYSFLRGCGWNPSERGFGSLDYATFSQAVVGEGLTDQRVRDGLLKKVRGTYLREQKTA